MKRAGSQKLTGIPGLKNIGAGAGQTHTGNDAASGVSTTSPGITVIPAILIGKMQFQQTSVTGFKNVPYPRAWALPSRAKMKKAATQSRGFALKKGALILLLINDNFLHLHHPSLLRGHRGKGGNPQALQDLRRGVIDRSLQLAGDLLVRAIGQ